MTRRIWTGSELADLVAVVNRTDYRATPGDRHYGMTEPMKPTGCRCESPGFVTDDDEVRCWKCGSNPKNNNPNRRTP